MAGYDMKFRPKLMDGLPRSPLEDTSIRPNLLYNMYKEKPGFLQNLRKSTEGMPQSLFDLLINKRMGFNIGDKGYLNMRMPKSQAKFDRGEDEFGIDLTYDF